MGIALLFALSTAERSAVELQGVASRERGRLFKGYRTWIAPLSSCFSSAWSHSRAGLCPRQRCDDVWNCGRRWCLRLSWRTCLSASLGHWCSGVRPSTSCCGGLTSYVDSCSRRTRCGRSSLLFVAWTRSLVLESLDEFDVVRIDGAFASFGGEFHACVREFHLPDDLELALHLVRHDALLVRLEHIEIPA